MIVFITDFHAKEKKEKIRKKNRKKNEKK